MDGELWRNLWSPPSLRKSHTSRVSVRVSECHQARSSYKCKYSCRSSLCSATLQNSTLNDDLKVLLWNEKERHRKYWPFFCVLSFELKYKWIGWEFHGINCVLCRLEDFSLVAGESRTLEEIGVQKYKLIAVFVSGWDSFTYYFFRIIGCGVILFFF